MAVSVFRKLAAGVVEVGQDVRSRLTTVRAPAAGAAVLVPGADVHVPFAGRLVQAYLAQMRIVEVDDRVFPRDAAGRRAPMCHDLGPGNAAACLLVVDEVIDRRPGLAKVAERVGGSSTAHKMLAMLVMDTCGVRDEADLNRMCTRAGYPATNSAGERKAQHVAMVEALIEASGMTKADMQHVKRALVERAEGEAGL